MLWVETGISSWIWKFFFPEMMMHCSEESESWDWVEWAEVGRVRGVVVGGSIGIGVGKLFQFFL